MSARVWIVYAEVRGATGSALPANCGAYVECYAPASSAKQAASLARKSLAQDGYTLIGTPECIPFDADAWDDENDPDREVRSTAAVAGSEALLHYGTFRAWELPG